MIRILLALLLALSPAAAQQTSGPYPSSVGTASPGQIPGTTTNDNAAAGKVGQYVIATTTGTAAQQATSTITVTIASPAVVTWGTTVPYLADPNGIATCAGVYFTTTGALPTGITASTNYFVIGSSISGNTFQIATSCDNAIAGTAINTSGTQSGTHTAFPGATLTSAVSINLAGMALTAGDWDVLETAGFFSNTTTSVTLMAASTNTTTATLIGKVGTRTQYSTAAMVPGVANNIISTGPGRYSLSATTTIYCVASSSFTISTMDAWGGCQARRVR